MHCLLGKNAGGCWVTKCGSLDGQKEVCMDGLMEEVDAGRCLVYSFGVAKDWSFEDAMAMLGCRVRAFDPSIDAPERR